MTPPDLAARIEALSPAQRALFEARSRARTAAPPHPAEPSGVLVTVRGAGGGPPLFCVHPGIGSVLCYADLAARLGDTNPVLGLRPPPLPPGRDSYVMDDLVELYAAAVAARQPLGAVRLAGWSLGGMLALAVAARLADRGRVVDRLLMFDSTPPMPAAPMEPRSATLARVGEDIAHRSGRTLDGAAEALAGLPPGADVDRLLTLLGEAALLPAAHSARYVRDRATVALALARAITGWTPARWPGTVHVLRAASADTSSDGWAAYAGRVVDIPVPGTHKTMLSAPHVDHVAAAARACLDDHPNTSDRGGTAARQEERR